MCPFLFISFFLEVVLLGLKLTHTLTKIKKVSGIAVFEFCLTSSSPLEHVICWHGEQGCGLYISNNVRSSSSSFSSRIVLVLSSRYFRSVSGAHCILKLTIVLLQRSLVIRSKYLVDAGVAGVSQSGLVGR